MDSKPLPARESNLRIVLVGPTHPFRGGISHYTTLLCRHLRRWHEVRFLTFKRQYPSWLFPGRGDRDLVSDNTLRVDAEPVLDGVSPATWWRTARLIRSAAPDLLIVQWSVSYWIPLLWLLIHHSHLKTRVVMICHNSAPHERPHRLVERMTRSLQRDVMRRVDDLICHSASEREALQDLVPEVPVHVVPLPSYGDFATLSPGRHDPSPRGKPQILFFGFVRPYKGVDILLRAMPQVIEALPDARLIVAGEWWSSAEAVEGLLHRDVRDHVEIRDRYVSNEEMAALFRTADVVVLPYRSATQSAVVQLAFGFGVPVITTRVGGLPDVVDHEKNGFLVTPGSVDELAAAIVRYHGEKWRSKLARGVAEAREGSSWETMVETLERLVDSTRPSHDDAPVLDHDTRSTPDLPAGISDTTP